MRRIRATVANFEDDTATCNVPKITFRAQTAAPATIRRLRLFATALAPLVLSACGATDLPSAPSNAINAPDAGAATARSESADLGTPAQPDLGPAATSIDVPLAGGGKPGAPIPKYVETSPNGFNGYQWAGDWGSDGPILTGDLNGDGKTDVFMWRDSTKDWSVNLSTGSGFTAQRWSGDWGSDGPIQVGDLNGDGKDDVFMFRASTNDWSVNLSTGSGFTAQRWSGAWGTDGPNFVGDLNGDGKKDVFMWRAAGNDWTVNLSTGSGFNAQIWNGDWGSDGPIHIGDLNGDGKTDVFMFRSSTNDWSVNLSTGTGFTAQRWGGDWGTDGPIFVGDLNGDGKQDVFMWRAATNMWSVNISSGSNFTGYAWPGACGSDGSPVVGDFNGDGKTDIMMWRDGFKQWMVNLSTGSGFNRQMWNGDWGSDGAILSGDLNHDGLTDVFMWRDPVKAWSVNLAQLVSVGTAATTPACGTPAWGNVGPSQLNNEVNYLPCGGLVDDIQISPNYDGNGTPAMYISGSTGGGIWRSPMDTNFSTGNPVWTPLIDHIPGLMDPQRQNIMNVASVAVSPSASRTLYAGINTSPPELLKSVDGGNTWSIAAQIGAAATVINRVMVDAQGLVYVATNAGFFISTDTSGTSFVDRTAANVNKLNFFDVASFAFGNNAPTIFVAGADPSGAQTGIYTLTVADSVWTFTKTSISQLDMTNRPFDVSLIAGIHLSATPGVAIAANITAGGCPGVLNMFKATENQDGTFTWAPQWIVVGPGCGAVSCPNAQDPACNSTTPVCWNGICSAAAFTQGTYVFPIAVGPDGRLYGGGIGLSQSDGRGGDVSITDGPYVSGKTIHTDAHVVVYSPYDGKIYAGTDGGLFRFLPSPTGPGATWESLNTASLMNMLSESVSASPLYPNDLTVGHQDNGIAANVSSVWNWANPAGYNNESDQLYFDPNDPLGKTVYAWDGSGSAFQKSTNFGASFTGLSLYPPSTFLMAFHPTQFNRFIVTIGLGTNECEIVETTDGFNSYAPLNVPGSLCPTALAYVGSDYYVAIPGGGLLQGVPNGQGGVNWTNVWPAGNPQLSIVSIVGDPQNSNSLYLALDDTTARVFFKKDQTDGLWGVGNGLAEITGAGFQFPFIRALAGGPGAALALLPSYGRPPVLYAATAGGVYSTAKMNGSSTLWFRLGSGLADGNIQDVRVNPASHGVYIAQYGRSAWSLTDFGAESEPNPNGGFETGSFSGWTPGGQVASISTTSHSGAYSAQVGGTAPTNGDSTVSQTIALPAGVTTLSVWYQLHCPDTLTYDWATVTVTDNVTKAVATILPPTCTNNGTWVNAQGSIASMAGHNVTLTLTSHDDDYAADPTYTIYDDISVF